MKERKLIVLGIISILLAGCQNTSLDNQVDMASAIDMTFCDGSGVSNLVKGKTSTNFTCNKISRFSIPAKTGFKSDAEYIAEHYDTQVEVKEALCPDEAELPFEYKHKRTRENDTHLIECKSSGRAYIDAGLYRNTISDQLEYAFTMSSLCTESAPFQLRFIAQKGNKKTIQFECGPSRYTITTRFLSNITLDKIESINALSCDYTGFKSFNFNNRRATFQCGNGSHNTLTL
ncbi:hypothetical protein [Vibrio sp. MA40-2]|uniref:hypothetical protein n=1 Tax=Vibrio sp. MA40-2 TaxID=3391828 RepID=UPI0039A4467F